jgi:RNA polymerase sigma-70 factor (ECF subfamily)
VGDEEALVERSQTGDRDAFGELVRRLERPLFNVALRILSDREEARDATQTAFVKAWTHLDHFDRHHRFFSWIYRILLNEALNRRRKRRPEALSPDLPDRADTPPAALARERARCLVNEAVLELSPDQRDVVLLRHWLDLSYEDIGTRLGVPAKTVKSRLFAARRSLEAKLRTRGVESA